MADQWRKDLDWLLANAYPGHGGQTDLARDMRVYSHQIRRASLISMWLSGARQACHENRRALRILRALKTTELEGGNQDGD